MRLDKTIKNALHKMRERFLRPILWGLDQQVLQQGDMLRALSDTNFRNRVMLKRCTHQPINVLFVCHEPSLWNMFESVYHAMADDQDFSPLVVALPYMHPSLPEGQYKDTGMLEFCEQRNIKVILGYDKATSKWLNPASLMPDYVFFQTPYHVFPSKWSIEQISMIARICYVPYGGCIYAGEVDEVVNPISFFAHVNMVFKENMYTKNKFTQRFRDKSWFCNMSIFMSGCPKLDFLAVERNYTRILWRRGLEKNVKRILWTPRWHTAEGNCHFFDYKQFFIDFCKNHSLVDFIFRPHPLSLQNFLKTGELLSSELELMESVYKKSLNMVIDKGGGYEDTFVTSDILVSDMSTILFEYFATGKPIVYTHRVDHFNELGKELSEGFYWVRNSSELNNTLEMLISGHDPLKVKREEIRKAHIFVQDGGSGRFIKEKISDDYRT